MEYEYFRKLYEHVSHLGLCLLVAALTSVKVVDGIFVVVVREALDKSRLML